MSTDLKLNQTWPMPSKPRPITIIGAGGIIRDGHMPGYTKIGLPVAGRPDFQGVELAVTVTTPASVAEVERLHAETERRCPVFQLFSRAGVPIRSRWTRAAPASN